MSDYSKQIPGKFFQKPSIVTSDVEKPFSVTNMKQKKVQNQYESSVSYLANNGKNPFELYHEALPLLFKITL